MLLDIIFLNDVHIEFNSLKKQISVHLDALVAGRVLSKGIIFNISEEAIKSILG